MARERRNAPSRMACRRTPWFRSRIRASAAIDQITPRQMAGAVSPPKSVRNEMNGPAIARWYACETRVRGRVHGSIQRPGHAEAAPGGGSAPLRRFGRDGGRRESPPRPGRCGSGRPVGPSVGGAEPAGPLELAKEEQLVDLAQRPVRLVDRDPRQVGGQGRGFVRGEAPADQAPVGPSRRRGSRPGPLPGSVWTWWSLAQVRPRRAPRGLPRTSRGETVARVPVTREVPGRPCPTYPRSLDPTRPVGPCGRSSPRQTGPPNDDPAVR